MSEMQRKVHVTDGRNIDKVYKAHLLFLQVPFVIRFYCNENRDFNDFFHIYIYFFLIIILLNHLILLILFYLFTLTAYCIPNMDKMLQ